MLEGELETHRNYSCDSEDLHLGVENLSQSLDEVVAFVVQFYYYLVICLSLAVY